MAFKKKDKFAGLLKNISTNLKEASDFFSEYKLKNVSDLKILSETMKEFEVKGDTTLCSTIWNVFHHDVWRFHA